MAARKRRRTFAGCLIMGLVVLTLALAGEIVCAIAFGLVCPPIAVFVCAALAVVTAVDLMYIFT